MYKSFKFRLYPDKCQNEMNRDFNASNNILYEGIKLYMKEVMI